VPDHIKEALGNAVRKAIGKLRDDDEEINVRQRTLLDHQTWPRQEEIC